MTGTRRKSKTESKAPEEQARGLHLLVLSPKVNSITIRSSSQLVFRALSFPGTSSCRSYLLPPSRPTGSAKGLEAAISTPSQAAQRECLLGGSHCSAFRQQCPFYHTTGTFVSDDEHGCSKFFLFQDRVYPASHPCFLFQGSSSLVFLLRRPAVLHSATGVWAALGQTFLVRASPVPGLSEAFLGPCLAKCGP